MLLSLVRVGQVSGGGAVAEAAAVLLCVAAADVVLLLVLAHPARARAAMAAAAIGVLFMMISLLPELSQDRPPLAAFRVPAAHRASCLVSYQHGRAGLQARSSGAVT
jgi:hypothetical protein